jgi:cobalamin biosynthetic protein CobC
VAILHGGQLSRVAKQYQIPEDQWLDLSTGIAPFSYPIPELPKNIWQCLPTINDSLIEAAKSYYQSQYCWPVAGSQQLIEKLPKLWEQQCQLYLDKHVYLPKVGYKEHQQAWFKAGYQLHFYQEFLPSYIEKNSVVVVINPNNPRTDIFSVQQLTVLQKYCEQQQSLLIIDEAFADVFNSTFSFVPHITEQCENILVLRSFGKFFGLAGLRIGFVCSSKAWCEKVQEDIGPWSINGPALYIAELALKDQQWQQAQQTRLYDCSKALCQLLTNSLPDARIEANSLFVTVFTEDAEVVYQQLCSQAVYVRLTDEKDALRFGIPDKDQLLKLTSLLAI